MQIENKHSPISNLFDSSTPSPVEEQKSPFKSIFNMKIDNNSEVSLKNNFHKENYLNEEIVKIPVSVQNSADFYEVKERQELLEEAETAKKEEDQDIENAQNLITNVGEYLYSHKPLQLKAMYVNKEELFSAIKGFQKLTTPQVEKRDEDKIEPRKSRTEAKSAERDSNPIERRKLVLQFKDAKVTFVPQKLENISKQEFYQVHIAKNASAKDSIENMNGSAKTKELNAKKEAADSQSNQTANKSSQATGSSESKNPEGKNDSAAKEQLQQIVKNNSSEAAKAMSEDNSLRIGFKSLPESLKNISTDKVVKSNQESVTTVVANPEELSDSIDKIVPSGNLEELLNTQSGVIQVDPANLPEEVLDDQAIGFLENKSSLDVDGATENTKIMSMPNKEITSVNGSGEVGGKAMLHTPSSSVLERINQVAMVQKISKRIQLRQLREYGIVNLQLDPPELGKLMVKLTIKGHDIKVSILAESSGAQEMLKNHKNVFIQTMKESGLDITEFDVNMSGNSNQNTSSQMNENKERLSYQNVVNPIPSGEKEIKNDKPILLSDTNGLTDGHHISLIA